MKENEKTEAKLREYGITFIAYTMEVKFWTEIMFCIALGDDYWKLFL
jgi:hypothetical protein